MTRMSGFTRGRAGLGHILLPFVVILIGAAASIAVAGHVASVEQEGELDRSLAQQAGALESRMESIGSLVAGASAHFSRLNHDPAGVTDEDLDNFLGASGAQQRYGEMTQGLMYVAELDRIYLDQYVIRRRLSMPSFTVDSGPPTAQPRILWAETGGSTRHGDRLDDDPARVSVLDLVKTDHEVAMTGPIDGSEHGGTVELFGPVSNFDGSWLGWVGTTVWVDRLVESYRAPGLDTLHISDQGVPVLGEVAPEGWVSRQVELVVLGRSWALTGSAPAAGVNAGLLLAGLVMTLLAATTTFLAQRTRQRLATSVLSATRSRDRHASFLEAVVASLDVGILAVDDEGEVLVTNQAAADLLGEEPHADKMPAWVERRQATDAQGRPVPVEGLPLVRAMNGETIDHELLNTMDGTDRHSWSISGQPIRLADEQVGAVIAIHDITEVKAAERRLTRLAMHDSLTGLANRRRLGIELDRGLNDQREGGDQVTVLFMDLDRFKVVNDTIGHHRGDQMLIDVGATMRTTAHEGDVAARIGGDEFVLLCSHCETPAEARQLAATIRAAMDPLLSVDELQAVGAGVSVGLVQPDNRATVDDVLRFADLAMYEAKRDEDRAIRVYEPAMGAAADSRYAMERELRRAIENGDLSVAYQPLARAEDLAVVGVEALVRWSTPEISHTPDQFLPLAEQTGLIIDIDLQVLDMAVSAATTPGAPHKMSVNVSGRTLALPGLAERVRTILERHGLPPQRLTLELTETALIQTSAATDAVLVELANMGVGLALDDFGTGYASLAYLRRFPVRTVKIDRSFVDGMTTRPENRAIIEGTVAMAKKLSLEVVAEGVETVAQADALRELGCDVLQGYLLGRPGTLPSATAPDGAAV